MIIYDNFVFWLLLWSWGLTLLRFRGGGRVICLAILGRHAYDWLIQLSYKEIEEEELIIKD